MAQNPQASGPDSPRDPDHKPPVGALLALLLVAALVVGGWFLTHELGSAARLQDCVASGRTNCAPIASR